MALKKRRPEIDDIRGISIIVMILIHTNAYFFSVPAAFATLELSQFAVAAFIFCSAYLYFLRQPSDFSLRDFFSHLWKRVKRLILPYYLFLAGYTLFLFLSTPKKLTPDYFTGNLTLTGGIDFNWLVLLFIQLAVLMPVFSLLYRRFRPVYFLYLATAFIASLVFLFYTPLPWYRSIMWLPWSLVLAHTMHVDALWKNKKLFVVISALFLLMYIVPRELVLVPLHRSLRMYDNKYPPNIYHLAYSMLGLNVVYALSKIGIFKPFGGLIHFYSLHSYSVYFIHILVIYAVTVFADIKFNWISFYVTVIGITTIIQLLINTVSAFLRYRGGRQSGYSPARAN